MTKGNLRVLVLTLALTAPLTFPTSLDAQRSTASHFAPAHTRREAATLRVSGERSIPILAASGVVFGAAGLVAGVFIGEKIGSLKECTNDDCNLREALQGGGIGMSLTIPLGVHLANRRKGSYWKEALASSAIYGAGVLLAVSGVPVALLAIPPAQIASSILIARATAR